MADVNTFTLRFMPNDPAWKKATEAQRKAYWTRVGELAVARKNWELARALDVSGKKMPDRREDRADGASGPVLTPHGAESRSRKWIRFSVGREHVTVWWSHGWGKVLGYHARGEVRGAPKRDVIGLTPAGQRKVQAEALDWWKKFSKKKAIEPQPEVRKELPPRRKPGSRKPIPNRPYVVARREARA